MTITENSRKLLKKFLIMIGVVVAMSMGLVSTASATTQLNTVIDYPGTHPGIATATLSSDSFEFGNDILSMRWDVVDKKIFIAQMTDKVAGKNITLQSLNLFSITMRDGTVITPESSNVAMTVAPALTSLSGNPAAIRLSERDAGKKVSATFRYQSEALTFDVVWSAILRDGNCNVQQTFDITPVSGSFNMKYAKLIDVTLPDAVVVGKDNGQTVVAGNVFMGIENPMAIAAVSGNQVSIQMEKADEVISVGKTLHYTQSIGVVPEGQLRRGFLYYIQRERVHYRRPVLHYVSWFDMVGGFNGPQNEKNAMDRINIIGKEMVTDRGVKWDSFLLDDNWDDPAAQPVWNLHPTNFPNQFKNLKAATEGYGFQMGAWFSPFGGYGSNSVTRRNSNPDMEKGGNGFSLSGPKYNEAVRNMTFDMVDNQGVNLFKIDGIGGGLRTPGPTQDNRKDYEALLQLLLDIREHRPDYTVYVTVGTWSSPYWYWYADAIWRDGDDTPKVPVGNARQQVLTGRDSFVYSLNVKENILHPIAELSAGGFTFSLKNINGGSGDIDLSNPQTRKETKDDMRWFFASGYSLQEMPIAVTDIDKMAAADKGFFWDNLAEYAKWSRENIDLLSDSHMVGDPTALEVYGYASWSPSKGVLALRNPNAMAQTYTVNPRAVFDMPTQMAAPWTFTEMDGLGGEGNVTFTASTSAPFTVTVEPFSVLVYEAVPGATVDTNLALNRPVTDNGTDTANGFTRAGAVDGQVTNTNSNAWSNDGDAKAKDLWVMVALDDPTLISAVNVNWGGRNYTPNNYQVQVSMTGQEGTFTTAYTQTGKPTEMSNNIHTLTTPMVAKFVRLYMPQDAGATHTGFLMREMEVIGHVADIPTPPPAETINLARGKTVTASSTATKWGYALTGAVDGLTTEGNGGKDHAWSNNDDSRIGNVWVMVELDKISPISEVKIQWDAPIFSPAKYEVQVSTTGEEKSFTTMHTQNTKPAMGWVTHEFQQTNAKFVRIYMPQDAGASWNAYLMQELEVMGAAHSVPDVPKYNLTVTNGVGSGSFQAEATVTVSANASSGKLFTGWTASGITLSDEQKMTNPMTFTMPANHVTLTANYETATHTVTVIGGTGGAEYAEGATVTITAGAAVQGKVFATWTTSDGVVFADATSATTTFVMPAKAVTVTASYRDEPVIPPTNPGTVTPPAPKPQPPKTEGGTTTVTTQVKPVIKGDTATAEVSAKTISDAIASAVKTAEQNSTSATVEVNVTATDSAKNVEITLKKSSMTNLADGKNTQLLVSSAVASILFDSSALADIAEASTGDVKISAAVVDVQSLTPAQQQLAKNRPVFDFSIQSGGKDVAFEGGTAQFTVPYVLQEGERAEFVTVWYLDNAGKLIPVAGKYENGSVTCSVTHFSNYAVGYLPFVDVAQDWSYEGIVYAYNNRLFSGTGKDNFAPTDHMTRAMLWSVLYRLAGSPSKTEDTVWYADAQKWAMGENISDGTNPTGNITRQELTAILYRFAKAQPCETAISLFTDVEKISDWALDAVNWAVKTGLLHGSDGQLNPLHTASRAQVAAILQRFASLK